MSNIKPGDLVVVTKPTPCCGNDIAVGLVLAVHSIGPFSHSCRCGSHQERLCAFISYPAKSALGAIELCRLKRIDPLPESETQDNQESLTA